MPDPSAPNAIFRDREEFRSYHVGEQSAFWVLALFYGTAAVSILLTRFAVALPYDVGLPIAIFAFVVIGWAQYSIGNGMHEAMHRNLLNHNDDRIASLIAAYPIGFTLAYRDTHFRHHRFLGTNRDPEYDLYTHFPQTKGEMVLRLIWFFSGIPAALQFLAQQRGAAATSATKPRRYNEFIWLGLVQLLIFTLFFWLFGNPLYYFLFWILPIATVGKLLSSTRLLCEHGSPSQNWTVRTITGSRWQTWILGAFDFNYHGEHHLFPSIPYAGLLRLHRAHHAYCEGHAEYVPFGGRFEFYHGGYLSLLVAWFRALPWRRPSVSVLRAG